MKNSCVVGADLIRKVIYGNTKSLNSFSTFFFLIG